MNVEIGTEAAQFTEKECINGIFIAVRRSGRLCLSLAWSARVRGILASEPWKYPHSSFLRRLNKTCFYYNRLDRIYFKLFYLSRWRGSEWGNTC
jgi:hypothetical protein